MRVLGPVFAGIASDELPAQPAGPLRTSGSFRCRRFRAPDGRLVGLVERLAAGA